MNGGDWLAISRSIVVTHIATFDWRDFTTMRPAHPEYFGSLPQTTID